MAGEAERRISARECAALLLSSQAQCVPLVSTGFVKAGSGIQHDHLINVAFKLRKFGLFLFFLFLRKPKSVSKKASAHSSPAGGSFLKSRAWTRFSLTEF